MKNLKIGVVAKLAMLLATIIWGSSFIIVKDVVDTVPTNVLLAIRFLSAAVILAIVFHSRLKLLNLQYLVRGSILGVLLFTAYCFQTLGISFPETTPGKNAFLTAVYCVMVPFMAWGISKKRPDRYNIVSALVCIVGIGLVSLTNELTVGMGDLLSLTCGVFYALHIIAVSQFTGTRDAVLLTILQFASSGICALVLSLITERSDYPSIVFSPSLGLSIAYLTVFCTCIALTLQNFGQKHTDPSTASIILSLEAVFGVIFSVALGRENLTFKGLAGFILIFIAVIVSETKLEFLFRKNHTEKND